MNSIMNLLQEYHLFKKSLSQLTINQTYLTGSQVFMQGEPLSNVYFIHQGKIKIYRTNLQGKEQIINILQPGEMFPHQAFFRSGDYPAHAVALEDSTLFYIPIHSFEQFLLSQPEVCMKIFRVLGERIVDLQNRLEEQMLHNTREQTILLLIRIGKTHGKKTENGEVQLSNHFTTVIWQT